jgi:hypothetical protein
VFFDENTGENSCSGCEVTNQGTVKCYHATSFGYAKATSSIIDNDDDGWWDRVYANYVLYLMIVIDLYFVIALVFTMLKNDKKRQVKVLDVSRIAVDEGKGTKLEQASSFDNVSHHSKSTVEELYKEPFCKRFKSGFILKYRMITPFTTEHEFLNRISRTIVNVLVLYMIWVFSGLILYGIEDIAGSYIVSIIVCFIVARIFSYAFEFMLRNRNSTPLKITVYLAALIISAIQHLSIFLITEDMGSEFSDWGVLVLIVFIIDLVIWELASLTVQLFIAKGLAGSPDNFTGKRKFMEKLVTPPLLKAFLDA